MSPHTTAVADRRIDAAMTAAAGEVLDRDLRTLLRGVARLFGTLRPTPRLAQRLDREAPATALTLARRARRRRARYDLYLRAGATEFAADVALTLKAQQGSTEAVLELRRRLEPVIITRIYALGLRWNEEELTETVVGRVWDKLGTYRGDAPLTAWGSRVARNCLVNWIRAHDAHARHTAALEGDQELQVPAPDTAVPDACLVAAERHARLRAQAATVTETARAALTPAEWELLLRVVVEEVPYAELAARDGERAGTLRVRVHRALCKLREAVAREHGARFTEELCDTLAGG